MYGAMTEGHMLLAGGALLVGALAASLLAVRVRVPSLVLFLGIGMLIGSEGLGWVTFDDYKLARTIGIVALALILFEGGLTSGLLHVRDVLGAAASLALVGTMVTAFITGFAAAGLFGFSTLEGLLLGAILASTDGAAIFALLRSSTLKRRLASTLEAESGLNDPVALLLVLGFINWLEQRGYGLADMLWLFVRQLTVGVAVGLATGWLATQALRRARLATAGLYPVASLATVALAYGAADSLHGSGFLSVYLAGLMLGSVSIPAQQTITHFHQGLSWVAQLTMFVVLGLLVFPSQLGDVAFKGTVLALILVLVARPLAAALATLPFAYSGRDRVLLGWAGLKGAVPVVLAIFPVIEHVEHSLEFFNIVFFAVLLSTLLQGTTFEPLAKRLGLTTTEPALPRPVAEAGTIRALGAEVLEFPIGPDDAIAGARVRDLGLPRDAVVNVIVRGQQAIPPRGSTLLRAGDELHLLIAEESAREVYDLTSRWRTGPVGPPPREGRELTGTSPIFSVWAWSERDGDPARPKAIRGQPVIEQLRIRRDVPGGLFALADGRYAVSGPQGAIGGRAKLSGWARGRMRDADTEERAWLQTIVGALASDLPS
jgi:potassium/hydrogen antiporter